MGITEPQYMYICLLVCSSIYAYMTVLNLFFRIIHTLEYFFVLVAILDYKLLDAKYSVSFSAVSHSQMYVTDIQDFWWKTKANWAVWILIQYWSRNSIFWVMKYLLRLCLFFTAIYWCLMLFLIKIFQGKSVIGTEWRKKKLWSHKNSLRKFLSKD